jgi:pyruvate dehydrogenase E2 component (dihydrolipoamide acetyltransferase)
MYIIRLPQKARIPAEGVISQWLVSKGKQVEKGEIIARLEVFGQNVELESPVSAEMLEIIIPAGASVYGRQPLAILGKKGDNVQAVLDSFAPKAKAPAPVADTVPVTKQTQIEVAVEVKKEVKMESKAPTGKVIPVLMPQAGQTMEEGTLLSWKVKQGDTITTGQVIMEIETDKATMEVEAANSGRLARIVVNEGQSVPVKTPVAYLADDDADVDAFIASQGVTPQQATPAAQTQAVSSSAPAAAKTPAAISDTGRVKASPASRKAAEEKGINIASVGAGSGPGGRILSVDVTSANVAAVPAQASRKPLSKMRKAIAQNLAYSKQNIPHFYIKAVVEAQAIFSLYKQLKNQYPCSVNDFVTLACAKAIRQFPAFRSQWSNGEINENPSVNIGIAVGTDNGLTVPVLLNVDKMQFSQLGSRVKQMAENARNGKVESVGQGIFTITNMGMFGVEEFYAIINPPESAILAVGTIREDVKVENGSMRPTRLMTLCLSVDHRVIDGVAAAQFMAALKQMLEKPETLVG